MLGITLGAVLVVTALLVTVMGRLLIDQRRADAAADLAALAAAGGVQSGSAPCAAGAAVAEANGASLQRCLVDGPVVTLSVGIDSRVVGHVVRIVSEARAGPVS